MYGWRPLDPGQVGRWAELLAAIEAVDHADEVWDESDLLEEFDSPRIDFARGSVAVYDGGQMVGFCLLTLQSADRDVHEIRQIGGVRPSHRGRGIGSDLLAWAEQAAVPLHRERHPDRQLAVKTSVQATNADGLRLLADHGYEPSRWFHRMQSDLRAGVPDRQVPEGVTVVGLTADRSSDALAVRNDAFRDHWGSTETTAQEWAHQLGYSSFRPDYSLLAYAGDEPVGVVIGHEYDADTRATGVRDLYVSLVATRRSARKRGLATALLARTLAAARAGGFATSSLDVDADSLTGAVAVYERLGYAVKHSSVAHTKALATP